MIVQTEALCFFKMLSMFWQYWICCCACFFFFYFCTSEIVGSVSEKQTSFSCPVKIGPCALRVVLLSHFQAVCMEGSGSFYPHREPAPTLSLSIFTHSPIQTSLFSHQPHNEGFVLVLFVHLWYLFFDCSLSADGMQRMQICALLFLRPLPCMNATLNEDTLAHIYSGGMETCTYYNQWICMPSLTRSHLHVERWQKYNGLLYLYVYTCSLMDNRIYNTRMEM